MQFYLSKNSSNTIKFASAIMIMLHHYSQYVCANNLSESVIFRALSYQAGFLGVAIFFFLSGFGLMESESKAHLGIGQFLKKRLLKIYLPVLFVSAIWLFISPFAMSHSPFADSCLLQTTIEGGKVLYISNILYSFGDDVLWFIKILIPLYIIFYLFSFLYQWNRWVAISFIWIITVAISAYVALTRASYEAISIVYFTLGVQMSLCKVKSKKELSLYIGLISLVSLCNYFCFDWTIAQHGILNAVFMAVLICVLSLKRIDIKIPSLLALLSFDIYLIHNKVLLSMKDSCDHVELISFVVITLLATSLFYLLRSRLLKV